MGREVRPRIFSASRQGLRDINDQQGKRGSGRAYIAWFLSQVNDFCR